MKLILITGFTLGLLSLIQAAPRVIISTDIGGSDPDDHQSMIHYLVYADQFDTEGLISSPPHKGRAKDIEDCLEAYESDFARLSSWSENYPSPNQLRALVRQGALEVQPGREPVDLSDGAKLIIERAGVEDLRPLYILVWGSITDVAQAVHRDPSIKKKIRVYSIGSWNTQQGRKERDHLYQNHPDLWWIESDTTFRGMYTGGNQAGDLGNQSFPKAHVAGHGKLGDLFMQKKKDIKMGDTPSVLYLLHGDPAKPGEPHWGGAFFQPEPVARPDYWYDIQTRSKSDSGRKGAGTVNQWREAYLRDWQQRMDRAKQLKTAP
ncbi:MAG: DUF1593 domain-containing protein [Verrucomicrobiales bacterium]|nr:DUF1593 domain-containing protein [Verrucomicrobiales bacterium]